MRRLLVNAVRCKDGFVLMSRHRHDFNTHGSVTVDGGLDYLRRLGNPADYDEISLYEDSPHTEVRELFEWGTRGINGTDSVKYVKLKNLQSSHIDNIIRTQTHIPKQVRDMFIRELHYRGYFIERM